MQIQICTNSWIQIQIPCEERTPLQNSSLIPPSLIHSVPQSNNKYKYKNTKMKILHVCTNGAIIANDVQCHSLLSLYCWRPSTWFTFQSLLFVLSSPSSSSSQVLPVTIVALVLSAIVRLNAALLDDVVQVEIPAQQDFGSTFYPAHRHLAIIHIFHGQISVN